jgi:hypothetical protein
MGHKAFLFSADREVPPLFGQLGDTVYVYYLGHMTDVPQAGDNPLPDNHALHQNYPNPFNPTTEIEFSLPVKSDVRIDVFNALGLRVKTVMRATLAAGQYLVQWDGTNSHGDAVASGVYFYRLTAGDYTEARKMVLLK